MLLSVTDLEAQIEEEMRLTSNEYHGAAWAEGLLDGIEPEIIAESAIVTALTELSRYRNEDAIVAMLDQMKTRVSTGEFCIADMHH